MVKLAGRVLLNIGVVLAGLMIVMAGLTMFKVVSPLIVISGSMEPEIPTGSLIISTSTDVASLKVGDVASFPREDGVLVTHRITSIDEVPGNDSVRSVRMKGDANNSEDQSAYVQSEALTPLVTIPVAGTVVAAIGNHKYELIAILCFGTGIYLLFKMIFAGRNNKNKSTDDDETNKSTTEIEKV